MTKFLKEICREMLVRRRILQEEKEALLKASIRIKEIDTELAEIDREYTAMDKKIPKEEEEE